MTQSQLFNVGTIAPPGADFASTGPHLHFQVEDAQGRAFDPETAKSFLMSRLLVGDKRTPLATYTKGQWIDSFPVTSGFGHREAPTAGASTEHKGEDFGIGQGTSLAWSANPGDTYEPDKGFGSIHTTDAKGNPFTVKLLHTTPGTRQGFADPKQQLASNTNPGQQSIELNQFYFPGSYPARSDTSKLMPAFDPMAMLTGYASRLQSSFNPLAAITNAASGGTPYG